MAEFYETGYGKRFFDGQLPALINQLERIAGALEKLLSKVEVSKTEPPGSIYTKDFMEKTKMEKTK